jgi:hypothetical protein
MIDRTKKLPARFYVSSTGRNPVREWILDLPSEDRKTVGKDIQKVEFGWPIGRPHCAPLGDGLWEVRSDLDEQPDCASDLLFGRRSDDPAPRLYQENAESAKAGY